MLRELETFFREGRNPNVFEGGVYPLAGMCNEEGMGGSLLPPHLLGSVITPPSARTEGAPPILVPGPIFFVILLCPSDPSSLQMLRGSAPPRLLSLLALFLFLSTFPAPANGLIDRIDPSVLF